MYSPTCYQTQTSLVESSCTAPQRKPYKDHSTSYSLFRCFSASYLLIIHFIIYAIRCSSGSRGQGGHGSLGSAKISHQKIAAEGGRIDFMFLAPLPLTRPLDQLLGCAENLIVSSFQFFLFELFVQCDLINVAKSIVDRNHI